MGVLTTEDENHFLYNCYLYASLRTKLLGRLNKSPEVPTHNIDNEPNILLNLNLNKLSLQQNLMNLLSSNTAPNINDVTTNKFNIHHVMALKSHHNLSKEAIHHRRSYIVNCISSYIKHAFDLRWKYFTNINGKDTLPNKIVIKFNN